MAAGKAARVVHGVNVEVEVSRLEVSHVFVAELDSAGHLSEARGGDSVNDGAVNAPGAAVDVRCCDQVRREARDRLR